MCKIVVNGISESLGLAVANSIIKTENLNLIPISVNYNSKNKKIVIDDLSIALINNAGITENIFCKDGKPNIVIDLAKNSSFRKKIPNYLDSGVSFIFSLDGPEKDFIQKIKNLGVNIVLLPSNCLEPEVMSAIRYLRQKNKEHVFGKVFLPTDII